MASGRLRVTSTVGAAPGRGTRITAAVDSLAEPAS
jgi:hypothetical protein